MLTRKLVSFDSNKGQQKSKSNRVDIKVRNQKNQIILIEVQFEQELDYLQHILFGTSTAIVEHMHESALYRHVSKVISVNILYFDLGRGDDYVYVGRTEFTGLHTQHRLELSDKQRELLKRDRVNEIFPEYYLIQVNRFNDVAKDALDEWIYFLKNETIEDSFQAKGLREAKTQLDVLKLSETDRQAFEAHLEERRYQASMFESSYGSGHMDGVKLGREEGRKEGREEGRQEGDKAARLEIARSILSLLNDDAAIAEKTKLSLAEIQQLRIEEEQKRDQ